MAWAVCWRDMRRRCLHNPDRAANCIEQASYCQEAKQWPNVKKQIERLERDKQWRSVKG